MSRPGIEKDHPEVGEIVHVARHKDEVMFKRRCRDHAICRPEWRSFQLAFTVQNTPTVSYAIGHRQDASLKARYQLFFEPLLQVRATLADRKNDNSPPQLSYRHSA